MEELIDTKEFILSIDPDNIQSIMITTTSGRVVFEDGQRAKIIWRKLEEMYNNCEE